ncbi:hypothetical protein R3P38DRAFT_3281035 [Favolaschia claudopus]|uniref:Transmembrane protein n=1 Tax=Favolaschia claudopus TaxID=2862362 RepID=A0AAW0AGN6_9AGAR
MAPYRPTLSRRDALLLLLGASLMHLTALLFPPSAPPPEILIDTPREVFPPDPPPPPPEITRYHTRTTTLIKATTTTATTTRIQTTTVGAAAGPAATVPVDMAVELPVTEIVAHAPGWTLYRNLYMSNGTLLILTDAPDTFPPIRMMASNPLDAVNNKENIEAREPTAWNMDFIGKGEARRRWENEFAGGGKEGGGKGKDGKGESGEKEEEALSEGRKRNRVWSVEGNTVLVNEPSQFLRHYYHLVAELLFGVQAFWHGALTSRPSAEEDTDYALHPSADSTPPITRLIFARATADGWRDSPGFNAYVLRAAFPSVSVEVMEDWEDRVRITAAPSLDAQRPFSSDKEGAGGSSGKVKGGDRAWHFPLILLTDRSASHRGDVCGSQTQRIAAEAVHHMRGKGKLGGVRVGGWWEPVRGAVVRFAGGLPSSSSSSPLSLSESSSADSKQEAGDALEGDPRLPMPPTILITYVSRQSAQHRKLTEEGHKGVVSALEELVRRKNGEVDGGKGDKGANGEKAGGRRWELLVMEAEKLTKDEQVRVAGRTTILLGVHGNGLTHLVLMPPTRVSTVIEMFYPGGFAHDYQWTTGALGMKHFAVWNDTYRTEGLGDGKPHVDYPDGFQGDAIPAHGPTIAKLIEDRVEGRV